MGDNLNFFRTVIFALATLTGILAVWILAGELLSPRLIYFPSDRNEAEILYANRRYAAAAAGVGVVRGDLWTEAAITRAAKLMFEPRGTSPQETSQAEIENMRAIADRAVRLSPHDSRIWLVLADIDTRLGGNNRKTAEALKLSYYTGSNAFSLIPLRLLFAVQSDATSDEELQSLVSLDIQRIILQRPDLKPAIALAYKNALPKGREIIESTLEQVDPSFLATIAVPPRHQ